MLIVHGNSAYFFGEKSIPPSAAGFPSTPIHDCRTYYLNSGLTKVRVADVLTPLPTKDRGLWQRAFNSISSKHFDFVLCKSNDLSIICAIELNDRSHNEAERQDRDEFIRSACSGAALPLIEVPAKNGYVLQEVTDLLKPYIENISTTQTDISCEKCGSPMVLRTTKRGANVGKQFYGCTNYPTCRNIKDIEPALIEL